MFFVPSAQIYHAETATESRSRGFAPGLIHLKQRDAKTKTKRAKPATKKAKAAKPETGSSPRATSKTAQLIEMLKRAGGATLEEMCRKFGWQAHTTRALRSAGGSLTKKRGITVTSRKVGGGEHRYSIKG